MENIIKQILNNHSLPSTTISEGFIKDIDGKFDKVSLEIKQKIFNLIYDKWIELNDDEKFKSFLNKNC